MMKKKKKTLIGYIHNMYAVIYIHSIFCRARVSWLRSAGYTIAVYVSAPVCSNTAVRNNIAVVIIPYHTIKY